MLNTFSCAPNLKAIFGRYGLGCMGEPSRSYCLKIVLESYAYNATSADMITATKRRAYKQPSVTHTLVREVKFYLFEEIIC